MAVISTGATICEANVSKLWKNSRIRVGEQEHLCCGFLVKVKYIYIYIYIYIFSSCFLKILFSCSIVDRQRLQVPAPADHKTRKTENFSPQLLQRFLLVRCANYDADGPSPKNDWRFFRELLLNQKRVQKALQLLYFPWSTALLRNYSAHMMPEFETNL